MKKTIAMVLPALAGLMFLVGAAHADYAGKCAACHGTDGKSGMAKLDLTAATVTLAACKDAIDKGKGKMPAVKLVAPDTSDTICKAAPLNKK